MWNYRVIKSKTKIGGTTHEAYEICEVYYDDKGTVTAWSAAMKPYGEEYSHLVKDMEYMQLALSRPVLEEFRLPNGKKVLIVEKTREIVTERERKRPHGDRCGCQTCLAYDRWISKEG